MPEPTGRPSLVQIIVGAGKASKGISKSSGRPALTVTDFGRRLASIRGGLSPRKVDDKT